MRGVLIDVQELLHFCGRRLCCHFTIHSFSVNIFLKNPVKYNVEDISSVVELNSDGIQTAFD